MAENTVDVALLGKIAAIERKLLATCDLIPLGSWGFDESVQEKLRQQRNKVVNQHLTKKERKSFSNAQKGRFARTIGVANTVSEVLDWMTSTTLKDVQLKAATLNKPEKKEKLTSVPKKQQSLKPAPSEQSSDDDSDSEDETTAPEEKPTGKPVATVKPTPRAEPEKSSEISDEKMEEDYDSSDEETAEVVDAQKKGVKRKPSTELAVVAKKTKVDKELEKYENVDPTTLDPIESRKVAMLKLQKKIETFKQTRSTKKQGGGKAVTDAAAEKKMKRRMSKLQLKQRRAEEKKQQGPQKTGEKATTASVKQEDLPRDDDGKVVYSKFDFIVKDPKKKRLSTKEKKDKFTGKDYKSLLNKVEKRNEKLNKLKETEPERAKEMEEEIKWNRALKKAQGVKVKDNVELLKKGLKNKEKAKEKRLAKWQQREHKVSADKTKKQEKRTTNLKKRIDDKKKSKMAKLRAKGRIL